MKLTRLILKGYRNYESLDIKFDSGVNAIVGENASGKTNLLEAIHYLSLARSFRTNDDKFLIPYGGECAYIHAFIAKEDGNHEIEIELNKEGKRITIDGKKIRKLSELSKFINVISFSPSDVPLFMGSPGERRNFIDLSISKQSDDYLSLISKASQLLKERNALLKSDYIDSALLRVLTDQLAEVSAPIISYRRMFVSSLNEVLPSVLSALRREKTDCSVVYRPFVKDDARMAQRIAQAYQDNLESDKAHRSTNIGIHREDISFILNGRDIADYGSQGENRMAVLSLKLCPYFMVEAEDKKPIVALDDVTSELDENHVEGLFELLKDIKQSFITTTDLHIGEASYIDVSHNRAIRR